ncbi:MAG: DUF371 domain-containing protein [Thermoprotei archaeon]|nr:MAG: DUF371 domain-containing protein [Thermoprotei archaeon]RLF24181.1 MAG: DUF371 domain-containing protein [Thermoprotei archaeon]
MAGAEKKIDSVSIKEVIIAHGHENISAKHPTTIEITKEDHVTPRGDCIIAVKASKALADLSEEFKSIARSSKAIIKMRIIANGVEEEVVGRGDPQLTFKSDKCMVIRRSSFVCDRTLMIKANKAAKDLDRQLIKKLKDPKTRVIIILEAMVPRDNS